jgi:hypothetical protein
LTVALPLAALAIAGCGGGGDSTESTAATTAAAPPALSKAELISQGDAICAEVNAAVGASRTVTAEGEESEFTAKVASLYTGMVESLKRLGTPEDEAGYAEFSAAADELSEVEGEVKLAAEREDTVALGEAEAQVGPALEAFQSAAGEYGFEDCSEGPSAPAPAGAGAAPAEEGGVEVAPEEAEAEAPIEEAAPEEVAPETGGAGGGVEEAAPEAGGGETGGGSSGGVGPG